MNVQVHADLEALAESAATVFFEVIANAAHDPIAVCLSGGSTPQRLYELLREQSYHRRIPWERVHWFWGDERLVPSTDGRSNAGMAWAALLSHAPAPLATVHLIPTTSCEPAESAELYERALKTFYGAAELDAARPLFDLVLLGLGEDGHTASLFPDSPALRERKRWVTSVEEAGQAPYVPRVTLTLPVLESAREVLFLVSGSAKRHATARVLAGEDVPAARVRPVGRVRWFLDRAAAAEGSA
jgi:6-phosphogluconolactonase